MNHKIKVFLHNLFIKYPGIGWFGYELMRYLKSDIELKNFLRKLNSLNFKPNVILDVGANRGEWTLVVQSVFSSATFYLIEPQEEMSPFLRRVCSRSAANGCHYFIAGAGAKEGNLEIAIWDDFAGTSIMAVESGAASQLEKRTIPIITIDSVVEKGEMEKPDLIKVDVQGFELEVIKGGLGSLSSCEVIILEVSLFRFFPSTPIAHEVVSFMNEIGYVIYDVLNLRHRPFDNALGQIDICFVKREGFFRKSNDW